MYLAQCCNKVDKLLQHLSTKTLQFAVLKWLRVWLRRNVLEEAFPAYARNTEMILFRYFHDHTSRVLNSVEAIFPRGFYVHVRLLHFLRFFLFHVRKPLAFSTYNLIVAISNQFFFP